MDEPDACLEQFAPLFLAVVEPVKREAAQQALRDVVTDEQSRLRLMIWAYQGPLRLYESGAFDNVD